MEKFPEKFPENRQIVGFPKLRGSFDGKSRENSVRENQMERKFLVRNFPKNPKNFSIFRKLGPLFRKFWKELSHPHATGIFRKLKSKFFIERKAPHVIKLMVLICLVVCVCSVELIDERAAVCSSNEIQ